MMKALLAALILSSLTLAGCKDDKDRFALGDDIVSGDNSQVAITVNYGAESFYTPLGQILDIKPTTTTVGIYDTDFVFSIFPSLPASFSFNPADGSIYGIPLDYQSVTYIVTAAKGIYTQDVLVTLNFVPPMTAPTFLGTNLDFSVNEITSYTPISNPGAVKYRITPALLPDGITFNTRTGVFSGFPSTISGFGESDPVTVVAIDNNGVELSRAITLTRVPQLSASLVMNPLQTLGVTGGSLVDLSNGTIGGRGNKTYSIASGGGNISGSGIYTTPMTAGMKSVSVKDLYGNGSIITLQFEIALPAMSLADVTLLNPVAATQDVNFTVALDGISLSTASFNYTTADSSDNRCSIVADPATSGVNFLPTSGVMTIDPGTSFKQVPVTIVREGGLSYSKRFCIIITPGAGGTSTTEEILAIVTIIP